MRLPASLQSASACARVLLAGATHGAAVAHHQVATATLACASPGPSPSPQPTHLREPLDHITNSLAAAGLQDDAPGEWRSCVGWNCWGGGQGWLRLGGWAAGRLALLWEGLQRFC